MYRCMNYYQGKLGPSRFIHSFTQECIPLSQLPLADLRNGISLLPRPLAVRSKAVGRRMKDTLGHTAQRQAL